MLDIEPFLEETQRWAEEHGDIIAVMLVGSWARGDARPDSDVDLVLVTRDPQKYLEDTSWLLRFGEAHEIRAEDWGLVQSRRAFYTSGLEVEFGITTVEWTNPNPVDPGTRRVVTDGARPLYDPYGVLQALLDALGDTGSRAGQTA